MRRKADVAHSATNGAYHALHAACLAAREAQSHAAILSIAPDEARAIRDAAAQHVQAIENALRHAEEALRAAADLNRAVERAEITRFGLPVLRPTTDA